MVLAVVALALGACGRKSGLDLPPSASAAPQGAALQGGTAEAVDPKDKNSVDAAQQNLFNSGNPSDRQRYAPKLPPKRIILDPILD